VAHNTVPPIATVVAAAGLGIAAALGGVAAAPNRAYAAFFDNVHWTIATSAAAWLGWLGYRAASATGAATSDRMARFWFACGLTSYAIGQILWTVQFYVGWMPFPAPSDFFYLLIGPLCVVGFVAALRPHAAPGDGWAFGLDAAALAIGALAIVLAVYLPMSGATGILPLAVLVAYPVGLLGAVCCGLAMVMLVRPHPEVPWIMLMGSLALMGLVWMTWNALLLNNAIGSGTGMNAMFSLASLMCGYGAATWRLRPSANPGYARVAGTMRFLLPMALVLLACAAIVVASVLTHLGGPLRMTIGAGALVVAVLAIVRQSLFLKERDSLLQRESAVRRRAARFDQMAASIEDAIFVSRVEGKHFVYEELNPAALSILGRRAEDAIGHAVHEVLPAHSAEHVLEHYRRGIATGQPQRYQIRFDMPSGPQWYDTLLLPLRDAAGNVTHVHGLSRNVTALKLQTEKLELLAVDLDRARHEAESANLAKSMFLAKMSHELRTPLNAILGFTELMDRQVFGPVGSERYQEYINDIHHSGRLLLSLVNDVLDLSKLEAGHYQLREESVDLGEIAAATCAMFEQQARAKDISLTRTSHPLPRVTADRRAIGQILMNLIANALKFTPRGGRVEVTTGPGAGGAPELIVRDNGVGIRRAEIHAVRAAFVQGSSVMQAAEGGSGLGLAIVCSMVELHGGEVLIDSEEGEGTTVTVRLTADRIRPPET
jgi:PAS domain S-box-containing protein